MDVMVGGESDGEVDEEFFGTARRQTMGGEQDAPGLLAIHAARSWE